MGQYRVARVCPNGHVATRCADQYTEFQEQFCSKCGEATLMQCTKCNSSIRGDYDAEGVISIGFSYTPPAYCHNCGNAFPWTERKIACAVEFVEVGSELPPEELEQFRADLTELTKDGPKTQVASLRFKNVMAKAGSSVASGVRDIVVDVLSETAKRAIWGS